MAFNLNGSTDYLAAPVAPAVAGPPLTIACWFNIDVTAAGILMYLGHNLVADGWYMQASGNSIGYAVTAVTMLTGTPVYTSTSTGYTVGNWHHACATFASATNRSAYLDGGGSTTDTASATPTQGIVGLWVGAGRTAPDSIFVPFDGRVAEAAIWDVVLTPAEVASLARGVSPVFIRPENLQGYWPMIGHSSPAIDIVSMGTLMLAGAPAIADHCRVFYPAPPQIQTHEAQAGVIAPPVVSVPFSLFAPAVTVAPLAGTVAPPLVSNPFQVFAPAVSTDLGFAVPLISNPFTVYAPVITTTGPTIQEDSRELEPHNLKVRIVDFVGGDDLRITRTYTELAEGILISKGYLTIKRYAKDNTDAEAIVQKTITTVEQMSGIIVDNDTTGGSIQMYFDLSNSDTSLLTPLVPYHYDVQVHTIGNAVYTCEKGVIVMQQGVTHTND